MNEENKKFPRCPARDDFAIIAMQERELQKERARRESAEKSSTMFVWVSSLVAAMLTLLVVVVVINVCGVTAEKAAWFGMLFFGIAAVEFGTAIVMGATSAIIHSWSKERKNNKEAD